jgi:hypothetical protein
MSTGIKIAVFFAKVLRKIKLQAFVRNIRARASLELFRILHENVIHTSRLLGESMKDWNIREKETTRLAQDVCTSSRKLMANLLELKPEFLHCCIKVLQASEANNIPSKNEVITWIRSEPSDARPLDPKPHIVEQNTVWSALLGCYDGAYNWKLSFKCFSSNNLSGHDEFNNSRDNWKQFYHSVLVFPIHYLTYNESGQPIKNVMGFLAFDSPLKNAFGNAPDIFYYKDSPSKRAEYDTLLSNSTAFQIGAVIADTLGVFLSSAYSQNADSKDIKCQ